MFIAKDEDGNLVNLENVLIVICLARARKMIEMLVDGTLPLPRFTAVADKLITLPLWSDQHKALG